jgi:hypothetical protein
MKTRINSPIYLASVPIDCWRCGKEMPAVAIIAKVSQAEGEICTLLNIRSLPGTLRTFIQKRFPTFRLKYSKTTKSEYYASTCPKCGVLSGDFFLHGEPGAPFFPTDKEEAACLTVEEIPVAGPLDVEAGLHMGTASLILEHAKRKTGEQST